MSSFKSGSKSSECKLDQTELDIYSFTADKKKKI